MTIHFLLFAPLGLLPVLIFLGVLLHLDSFRLVAFRIVLQMLLVGALAAAASYLVNDLIIGVFDLNLDAYSKYGAPFVEETLKAIAIIYMFARSRIGFMVDAAIVGFAIGAGFALVENVYYLYVFEDANVGVWIVRGFGTAIMHGGATAIFGVVAQSLGDESPSLAGVRLLPGILSAIAVRLVIAVLMRLLVPIGLHSLFNQFPGSPIIAAATAALAFPLVLFFVFSKSEHKIHDWLIHDYESHEHLLEDIRSGAFSHSEAGRFISKLAEKAEPSLLADIFSYIRLHTELVLQAERMLLAREKGEKLGPRPEDRESFDRLHKLERQIGRTALLALWPHLHFTRQEMSELYEFEEQARHPGRNNEHSHG